MVAIVVYILLVLGLRGKGGFVLKLAFFGWIFKFFINSKEVNLTLFNVITIFVVFVFVFIFILKLFQKNYQLNTIKILFKVSLPV